ATSAPSICAARSRRPTALRLVDVDGVPPVCSERTSQRVNTLIGHHKARRAPDRGALRRYQQDASFRLILSVDALGLPAARCSARAVAAAAAARCGRLRKLDPQSAAVEGIAIELPDCGVSRLGRRHFDEAEATRPTR